ncbi:MAG: hypothetical protein PHG54_08825 [Smithellaceae bacterium]|jgi:uncharacterized membrane protein|nr:hypothetical protein [Smithellaceae bacterium]NLX53109.1 hypothetical protein [Deltaproteobacteria bacterium]
MENFVRCKACGFVTEESKVGDVCPACGVPAKMFEPYKHPVSLKRRKILDLHTHPVLVHFPQAFALTLLLLAVVAFFPLARCAAAIYSTITVLSVLLPFSVLAAVATGLLDGKLRFRKVTTPLLKKKMILSLIFFTAAAALAILALWGDLTTLTTHLILLLLALVVSLCGGLLGLIGGKLLDAKFPG